MTTSNYILFALLGITFIFWAITWFRALFTLNKIARQRREEQNAGYFKGIGITMKIFREFATAPEHKSARRRVVLATVLVFAVIIVQMLLVPLQETPV